MPSVKPFIDPATGELDTTQILSEAVPIARLVVLFAGLSFVPFGLAFLFGDSVVGAILAVIGQFVLAVGAGIVLTYVVARGTALSGESAP